MFKRLRSKSPPDEPIAFLSDKNLVNDWRCASLIVAMNSVGRKGRQANCNVLRARGIGRAVAHPLTGIDDNGLPGGNLMHSIAGLHLQLTAQDDGELVELRRLTLLTPP